MWNELTFLWNELTILWNDLTTDWNDLTWNDLTMERNDRIPILQSPWLARGPTPGASRGHARYSSTRMFLANSGAVAQEKNKTRKQESPAHKYQSEIEGKAVLK